jgi:hypothetical protein
MAAIPQLQSSCGGSGVRLSTFVSVEVLKKGSGHIKPEQQKFTLLNFGVLLDHGNETHV